MRMRAASWGPSAPTTRKHRVLRLRELVRVRSAQDDKYGIANLSLPSLRMTNTGLADVFGPLLQILFHLRHELIGDRAVDDPVVVAKGQVNDGADGDGVAAVLVGDDHGLLGDAADAHDGRVRLVDDGEAEDGSELAGVGDGESGSFHIIGLEFLVAGALAEIGNAALQPKKVQITGILEDGNDESPIESDRDAHVDVAVIANIVAFNVGIDDGPLLQCNDGGAH